MNLKFYYRSVSELYRLRPVYPVIASKLLNYIKGNKCKSQVDGEKFIEKETLLHPDTADSYPANEGPE